MGAGKKVYTYVSFSSQNNSKSMGLKVYKSLLLSNFSRTK